MAMSISNLIHRRKISSGAAAEAAAAAWLKRQGLVMVEKNYRCKGGEIDLIMRDGSDLVFVEVRLRQRSDYGSAIESVTHAKQRRIVCAARHFLATQIRWQNSACRFDVIATSDLHENAEWQWLRSAFNAE
jgi:putative endonuclease